MFLFAEGHTTTFGFSIHHFDTAAVALRQDGVLPPMLKVMRELDPARLAARRIPAPDLSTVAFCCIEACASWVREPGMPQASSPSTDARSDDDRFGFR
jgi:hypothetical protein